MWKVGRLLNAAAFDAIVASALPSPRSSTHAALDARARHMARTPRSSRPRVLDDVPRGSLVACRSRLGCKLPYPAEIGVELFDRASRGTPLYLK